jgi:hypothetical protein
MRVKEISAAIAEEDLRIGEELAEKQDETDRNSGADARVEMGTSVIDVFAQVLRQRLILVLL